MSKSLKSDQDELIIANKELAYQNSEKEKRAAELVIANVELAYQQAEKVKRVEELMLANAELILQKEEKLKLIGELFIANKELSFQKEEKGKRATELGIADTELAFQDKEKEKRAAELIIANIELAYQNDEKEKRAEELTIANKELAFQNQVKEKRAAELIIANEELAFQNKEKEKRAAELFIANKELAFQNKEKEKRAVELSIANKELVFQTGEKEKRAAELAVADSFMSMASHELKTPVTTIKTLVQILEMQYKRSADTMLVEYLTMIGLQIDQLTKLVVDLLDVSKIKADKFELEEKIFDFDALAIEIVKSCQLLSPLHAISIAGKTGAKINGDRNSVNRVFINLITNAIKYSPKADAIDVTLSRTADAVRVGIRDFGIGIKKADQDKVFERYFQVGNTSGQSFAGLGIGLYITAAIIAQHRGRIWVESTEGQGSTFFFEFPIHEQIHEIARKNSHAKS